MKFAECRKMIIKTNITFPFLSLCLFMLLRPLFTTSYFFEHTLFGLRYTELFSIFVSYGFIVLILITLKKQTFDGASILLILFCLFCGSSFMWGSNVQQTSRIILPTVFFFVARANLEEESQITTLILLAILSYIVPVLISAYLIILNKVSMEVYWTGLDRYSGMYSQIHTLAHSMFIFLFFVILHLYFFDKSEKRRKVFNYFICLLSLIAMFDLVKTYTRTVYIGFYILLIWYLIGRRSYKLLCAIIIASIVVIFKSSTFQKMMYDFIYVLQGKRDFTYIGTGRIGIWTNFLDDFINLPFPNQLLGAGAEKLGATHNDILSLIYNFGFFGLFLYISFMSKVFVDIIKSFIDRKLKYIFLGFILAVLFMNLPSNSYISRGELAQYFYFIVGIFYVLRDKEEIKYQV